MAAVAASLPAQLQFAELPRQGLPVGGLVLDLVCADVDGDGDLDVIQGRTGGVANAGATNRLLRNDGNGRLTDVTATNMPAVADRTSALALGDVDADGDLDLVCGNQGQQNRLYRNIGGGIFTDATASNMPALSDDTNGIALGDVDGDGDLDMVVANLGQSRLLLNDGAGAFTDATASRLPLDADYDTSVALADVDGDGDLDILLGVGCVPGIGTCINRLYLNDGTGTFVDVGSPVGQDPTQALAVGDIDGDGDLDLVTGADSHNQGVGVRLFENDGLGNFLPAPFPFSPDKTRDVTLGDVDGDGDLDLVVANTYAYPFVGQGQDRLYLNDGAGTFLDVTSTHVPSGDSYTNCVALADLDGDGDLEAAFDNKIYWNLQRQLHASTAPQIGQPYDLDAYIRYGPPSTVDLAAIYLSTGPASIPTPFGTVGIDPTMAAPFPVLTIPPPAGVASVSTVIPNVPGLIGQTLYSQAMVVAYPNDLRLSNVVVDVIQ